MRNTAICVGVMYNIIEWDKWTVKLTQHGLIMTYGFIDLWQYWLTLWLVNSLTQNNLFCIALFKTVKFDDDYISFSFRIQEMPSIWKSWPFTSGHNVSRCHNKCCKMNFSSSLHFNKWQGRQTYICTKGALSTVHIDGWVKDCSIASVLAMKILQTCNKPLIL